MLQFRRQSCNWHRVRVGGWPGRIAIRRMAPVARVASVAIGIVRRVRWGPCLGAGLLALLTGCGSGGLTTLGSDQTLAIGFSSSFYHCPDAGTSTAPPINGVVLGPKGGHAYAICGGHSLVAIDLRTSKPVYSVDLGETGTGLVVSQDASVVYVEAVDEVAHYDHGLGLIKMTNCEIVAVSARTHTMIGRVRMGQSGGSGMALGPGGRHLYVSGVNSIYVIDTATMTLSRKLRVFPKWWDEFVVSPNGRALYAVSGTENGPGPSNDSYIAMIDLADGKVIKVIADSAGPSGVAVSPNGRRVYVTYSAGIKGLIFPWVKVFSSQGALLHTGRIGIAPTGFVIAGKSDIGYVAMDTYGSRDMWGELGVFDMKTLQLVNTIPYSADPYGTGSISMSADGKRLAVLGQVIGFGLSPTKFQVVDVAHAGS